MFPPGARRARIGIVLPTFNRASLLPQAVRSAQTQDFSDWELVIVDDGSTDGSSEVIERLCAADARIRSVKNDRYPHSCAGARQRGVDESSNELVAFLDSDDRWPSYHLSEHVAFLDRNPDVDWVFGDLRRVDSDGRVVVESKFKQEWARDQFPATERGEGFVMAHDGLVELALRHDFNPGLQCSLLRKRVFEKLAIRMCFCEDRLLTLEAAAAGFSFAYVTRIHLDYLVHGGNVSGSNAAGSFEQRLKVNLGVARYWAEDIPHWVPMTAERRAIIKRRLADQLVWGLGHNTYRAAGRRRDAALAVARGIKLRPLEPTYWKTLVATLIHEG